MSFEIALLHRPNGISRGFSYRCLVADATFQHAYYESNLKHDTKVGQAEQ